jgi:PKD repeat protein
VHRISYDPTLPVAKLSADKEWGELPLTVGFDAGGSEDPTAAGLSYAWDLDGNGSFETNGGATQTRTYNTAANRTISVRVTSATDISSTAAITIYPGDSPPAVSIDSPSPDLTWGVGQRIAFSGSAVVDSGKGSAIPASGLSWRTKVLHCPVGEDHCHAHPLPDFNETAGGLLTAPDHNLPSRLRFELTATDARGLSTTKALEVYPRTATLSVSSNPPGVPLVLGPEAGSGPLALTVIEGASATLSAPPTAEIGGVTYGFDRWSDGGARVHSVLAGSTATFTAFYAGPGGSRPAGDGSAADEALPRAPELGRHPAARTHATIARFEFGSAEPGVGFACRLDIRPLVPCGSPRVYRRLRPGRHAFHVYAEAPGDSVVYSPATSWRWRVMAR